MAKPPSNDYDPAVLEKVLNFIIDKNEGGYVNNPKDPGGETKFGISKKAYPDLDIKKLTKAQALEIYKKDYVSKIPKNIKDPNILYHTLDMAINAGPGSVLKVYKPGATLEEIKSNRLKYYQGLDGWQEFNKTWTDRTQRAFDPYVSSDKLPVNSGTALNFKKSEEEKIIPQTTEVMAEKPAAQAAAPKNKYTSQELLSILGDAPDAAAIEAAARKKGYNDRQVSKIVQGFKQSGGNTLELNAQGTGFNTITSTGVATKSTKDTGNKKGLDIGDLTGKGNKVNHYAGFLSNLIEDYNTKNTPQEKPVSQVAKTEAAPTTSVPVATVSTDAVPTPTDTPETSVKTSAIDQMKSDIAGILKNPVVQPSKVVKKGGPGYQYSFPEQTESKGNVLNQIVPSFNRGVVNLPSTVLGIPAAIGNLIGMDPETTNQFATKKMADAWEQNATENPKIKNAAYPDYDPNSAWYTHLPEHLAPIMATFRPSLSVGSPGLTTGAKAATKVAVNRGWVPQVAKNLKFPSVQTVTAETEAAATGAAKEAVKKTATNNSAAISGIRTVNPPAVNPQSYLPPRSVFKGTAEKIKDLKVSGPRKKVLDAAKKKAEQKSAEQAGYNMDGFRQGGKLPSFAAGGKLPKMGGGGTFGVGLSFINDLLRKKKADETFDIGDSTTTAGFRPSLTTQTTDPNRNVKGGPGTERNVKGTDPKKDAEDKFNAGNILGDATKYALPFIGTAQAMKHLNAASADVPFKKTTLTTNPITGMARPSFARKNTVPRGADVYAQIAGDKFENAQLKDQERQWNAENQNFMMQQKQFNTQVTNQNSAMNAQGENQNNMFNAQKRLQLAGAKSQLSQEPWIAAQHMLATDRAESSFLKADNQSKAFEMFIKDPATTPEQRAEAYKKFQAGTFKKGGKLIKRF